MAQLDYDPFGQDTTINRAPDDRPEIEPKKITAGKKRKKIDYESMSRKLWRDRGYFYDKCSFTQPYTGKSHDLFGFGDAIAVKEGDLVIVQTTSKNAKSEHIRKWLTEHWALFGGHKFSILDAIRYSISAQGVRFVFCCWFQPDGAGTKWVCEETEVTTELLDEWLAKRAKRAS